MLHLWDLIEHILGDTLFPKRKHSLTNPTKNISPFNHSYLKSQTISFLIQHTHTHLGWYKFSYNMYYYVVRSVE